MVLGVETALEEVQKLMKEIADLRKEISDNKALVNAKEALERLDGTMKDFDTNTQTYKLDKLARDISLYDKKLTYPYLTEEYYKQDARGRFSTRGHGGPRRYTSSQNPQFQLVGVRVIMSSHLQVRLPVITMYIN
ncbi:hypothetical protein NDU88_008129 [Pleurodeles waltl]|uniref:Uncharacterized protein n=1 Tax=Pleurodeles waltl TaxID=8319 RepID=A0AAV7RRG0_PLEWA|nr:hypothetical protein NDU88_008129 [Pleurodeles waltl]